MSQLSSYLPDNTISFIETQIRMFKWSKHDKQWSISDKMSPGFSDKVFDALKLKVASMPQIACQCAVTFDEISLKSALAYNSLSDHKNISVIYDPPTC